MTTDHARAAHLTRLSIDLFRLTAGDVLCVCGLLADDEAKTSAAHIADLAQLAVRDLSAADHRAAVERANEIVHALEKFVLAPAARHHADRLGSAVKSLKIALDCCGQAAEILTQLDDAREDA